MGCFTKKCGTLITFSFCSCCNKYLQCLSFLLNFEDRNIILAVLINCKSSLNTNNICYNTPKSLHFDAYMQLNLSNAQLIKIVCTYHFSLVSKMNK